MKLMFETTNQIDMMILHNISNKYDENWPNHQPVLFIGSFP